MKGKREAKLAAQVKKLRREKKDLEEQNTFLIQTNILAEERYRMLSRVSRRWKELARRRGGEALTDAVVAGARAAWRSAARMARNCDHSCVSRGHCDFLHAAHERLAKRFEEQAGDRDPRLARFIVNSILESRIRYSGMENDAEDD